MIRLRAVLSLLLLPLLLIPTVLWHGLPVLWEDYPAVLRRLWKSLVTGRTGPYKGVVW